VSVYTLHPPTYCPLLFLYQTASSCIMLLLHTDSLPSILCYSLLYSSTLCSLLVRITFLALPRALGFYSTLRFHIRSVSPFLFRIPNYSALSLYSSNNKRSVFVFRDPYLLYYYYSLYYIRPIGSGYELKNGLLLLASVPLAYRYTVHLLFCCK
jgi:hypothetical protein